MRRKLYTLATRDEVTLALGSESRRNTAAQSALSGGVSVSKPVSLDPGQIRFEFLVAGDGADRVASQFEELLNSDYQYVPFFGVGEQTDFDGYYVMKSGSTKPLDAQSSGSIHRVDSVLENAGTRRSHFRSAALNTQDVDNDFGTGTAAEVAVPSAASLVRWFDPASNVVTTADSTATRQTQFDPVDVFDATAAPTTQSELIYDLPFDEVGKTDVRVWDSRGTTKVSAEGTGNTIGVDFTIGSATIGQQQRVVQWQRVFVENHEFVGDIVIENGLLRLTLDDINQTIAAEEWDDTNEAWNPVSLGSSSWTLVDVDLTHVGPVAVEAQLLFEDSGSYQALDMRLSRGSTDALFATPANETAPSTGLKDLLSPIALTSDKTAMESLGLRKRRDVRR
ncbi:hypothetical protein C453_12656 [Haloferax elongans ATCC BAA-1513]|uniref:Uncharacterized protein n=1 Tax=Haloferax elongans ATCC BAA-1513 TaxID=1230453 RepID=M0HIS5_HALEO|nr:hypothetical protein [Haloferax elongans]ELZ84396.1 hypothetical protein C453_12656 [Haloferax elongans ATCC BAA-1513]